MSKIARQYSNPLVCRRFGSEQRAGEGPSEGRWLLAQLVPTASACRVSLKDFIGECKAGTGVCGHEIC